MRSFIPSERRNDQVVSDYGTNEYLLAALPIAGTAKIGMYFRT